MIQTKEAKWRVEGGNLLITIISNLYHRLYFQHNLIIVNQCDPMNHGSRQYQPLGSVDRILKCCAMNSTPGVRNLKMDVGQRRRFGRQNGKRIKHWFLTFH